MTSKTLQILLAGKQGVFSGLIQCRHRCLSLDKKYNFTKWDSTSDYAANRVVYTGKYSSFEHFYVK